MDQSQGQVEKNRFHCWNGLSNFCIATLHCRMSENLQQCLDYHFLAQHMQ